MPNTFTKNSIFDFDNRLIFPKEQITGGIELEPLLAIRRRKAKRYPLGSSDVTGVMDIKPK